MSDVIATLYDQSTDLTFKTKTGEPACTTSISGMTSDVEAATVTLLNDFVDDLNAAIHDAETAGATELQLASLIDLLAQIQVDIQAIADLVAANV